jgi:glycosyltransferase 2 family protein
MCADARTARRYAWLAARYALAVLLLFGVFQAIPFEHAWQVLRSASLPWLAAALLLLTISRWLAAVRTHALTVLHDLRLSVARLFEISCVSSLYAVALPGQLSGGVVRWYRIGSPQRNHSAATALVVVERLVDYAVLAVLGVIGWYADARAAESAALAWWLVLAAATLVALCAATLTAVPERAGLWLASRVAAGGALAARVGPVASRVFDALLRHRDPRSLFRTAALSLAVHAAATLALYITAKAIGMDLGFATVLWLRACTIAITAAAVTPAGLGVREVSTVLLLGLVGVAPAEALALSLLQLALWLVFAAVGGLLEARRYLLRSSNPPAVKASTPDANADVSWPK